MAHNTVNTAQALYEAEVAEAKRQAEHEDEIEKKREQSRTKRRNALRDQINSRTATLRALLDYLIRPNLDADEQRIVATMIAAEYSGTLEMIPAFIELGGERYQLERSLFSHLFED